MSGIHPDTQAALDSGNYEYVVGLIYMGFTPTPLRIAAANFPVSHAGDTYVGSGLVLDIGDVAESGQGNTEPWSVDFSNADQTITAAVFNSAYAGIPVTYSQAVCDANYQVIGDPIILFVGTIDQPRVEEDQDESTTVLEFISHWANFDAVNGRRLNPNSQKEYFPSDRGFEFAGESLQDLRWGRE